MNTTRKLIYSLISQRKSSGQSSDREVILWMLIWSKLVYLWGLIQGQNDHKIESRETENSISYESTERV